MTVEITMKNGTVQVIETVTLEVYPMEYVETDQGQVKTVDIESVKILELDE